MSSIDKFGKGSSLSRFSYLCLREIVVLGARLWCTVTLENVSMSSVRSSVRLRWFRGMFMKGN